MAKEITVQSEIRRLTRHYKNLSDGKKAIAQGLIAEAARLRVLCDRLYTDIDEKGTVELFRQSDDVEPYERDRPAARQYFTADKNYQNIIRQLDAMVPADVPGQKGSKLGRLMAELGDG